MISDAENVQEDAQETTTQDNNPFFVEIDEYLRKPLRSREELEADEKAQAQRYIKYKNEFNQSEVGKKLLRLRDDDYVRVAFQKLMEEMQQDTPWFREMMGGITDVVFADDPRYRALNEYYEQRLDQYIASQTRTT